MDGGGSFLGKRKKIAGGSKAQGREGFLTEDPTSKKGNSTGQQNNKEKSWGNEKKVGRTDKTYEKKAGDAKKRKELCLLQTAVGVRTIMGGGAPGVGWKVGGGGRQTTGKWGRSGADRTRVQMRN